MEVAGEPYCRRALSQYPSRCIRTSGEIQGPTDIVIVGTVPLDIEALPPNVDTLTLVSKLVSKNSTMSECPGVREHLHILVRDRFGEQREVRSAARSRRKSCEVWRVQAGGMIGDRVFGSLATD